MTDWPVTRTRSEARQAFLADVLSCAIEGGIGYWATVTQYVVSDPSIDGLNLDDTRNAYATLIENEDLDTPGATRHVVSLDTIARGWRLYSGQSMSGAEYGRLAMEANRTNGEDGDYDADVADNVLQLGIFGVIVYG